MLSLCKSDLQCFQTLRNCSLFRHIWVLRNFYSGNAHHANYGKQCLDHHFRYCAQCIWDLQCCQTFRNCWLFCTFRLLRNFYSADAHHANHGERCSDHHFWYCESCVYQIYSVFKLFEIPVCLHILAFTKFLLWWCAPCSQCQIKFTSWFSTFRKLCIWDIQPFETFRNCCSKMLFVLHILAFTKFLLRWCAPC